MFPHSITIYHHSVVDVIKNGVTTKEDRYEKQVLGGFYVMPSTQRYTDGKGFTQTNSTSIVSDNVRARGFGLTWTCEVGDRIVKGVGADITKWSDLQDAITVTNIAENVCGSDVDNIVITGV